MFVERTSVGLDVHARSVSACALDTVDGSRVRRRLSPEPAVIRGWLAELPGPVMVAYEAGPTGFGLARDLVGAGIRCVVAAPSKLPRPAGDRVKTDARDALLLAQALRADQLAEVAVPSVEQEATRDLVRAREDARVDLMRARHRLTNLLLRYGIVYYGGSKWTLEHDVWLRSQRFELFGVRMAFSEAYEQVLELTERRRRLDEHVGLAAADPMWAPLVGRLCCLRGIGTLTGLGLAAEVVDWERFTGESIGAFLGLVPTEHSSGGSRSQGGITKTGNGHVRRLLVEAAWHYRRPYRESAKLIRSREGQPKPVINRANKANRRLTRRWEQLDQRRKNANLTAVAIARELAGWCWSIATMKI